MHPKKSDCQGWAVSLLCACSDYLWLCLCLPCMGHNMHTPRRFDWIGDWYLWFRAGDFSDSHEFLAADKYPRKPIIIAGYWCLRLGERFAPYQPIFIWWYWGVWLQAVVRFQRWWWHYSRMWPVKSIAPKRWQPWGWPLPCRWWSHLGSVRFLTHVLDISGLFWVTVASAIFAIGFTVDCAHPKSGTKAQSQ